MVSVLIATLRLKPWAAFIAFVLVKRFDRLTLRRILNVVVRRGLDGLRRSYIREECFTVVEMWECQWCRLYKTHNNVKKHIRENFPYRRSFAAQHLLETKNGKLFGYVQGDIEVPENLRPNFANFPSIFKITLVSKNDIGDSTKPMPKKKE